MKAAGFTLVEVLVALTLASIAALLSATILVHVRDSATVLEQAVVRRDVTANGRGVLAELFASTAAGDGSDTTATVFMGSSHDVSFHAWGWNEWGGRRQVAVHLTVSDAGVILEQDHVALALTDSLVNGSIQYQSDYGAAAPLQDHWESHVDAPLAVRLQLQPRGKSRGPVHVLFWVGRHS